MSHTSYLGAPLNANTELYPKFEKAYALNPIRFDFLAGTGLSGTLSLAAMRLKYGYHIAIVRRDPERYKDWKPITEDTFDYTSYDQRMYAPKRWLLIDDCIGGGNTLRRVWTAISETYPKSILVGAFLWDWQRVVSREHLVEYTMDDLKLKERYDYETQILAEGSFRAPSQRETKAPVNTVESFWNTAKGEYRRTYTLAEMEDLVPRPQKG